MEKLRLLRELPGSGSSRRVTMWDHDHLDERAVPSASTVRKPAAVHLGCDGRAYSCAAPTVRGGRGELALAGADNRHIDA
jgi:hypothetical protein